MNNTKFSSCNVDITHHLPSSFHDRESFDRKQCMFHIAWNYINERVLLNQKIIHIKSRDVFKISQTKRSISWTLKLSKMSCFTLKACIRILNLNNTFINIKQGCFNIFINVFEIDIFFFCNLRFWNLMIWLWNFFAFTFVSLILKICCLSNIRFSRINRWSCVYSFVWTWSRTRWGSFL